MLLVRICAGGDGKPSSLPRLNRPFSWSAKSLVEYFKQQSRGARSPGFADRGVQGASKAFMSAKNAKTSSITPS